MRAGGRQRAGNALVVRVASKESVMYDSLKRESATQRIERSGVGGIGQSTNRKISWVSDRVLGKAPIERLPGVSGRSAYNI